jgi:SAM-dependent MidA family methyltransferase
MEAALYDPEDGFYARGPAIGRGGAFATVPGLHPAFADALATELRASAAALGGRPWTLMEVGPGDGTLALQLRERLSDLAFEHVLVERAAGLARRQQDRLGTAAVRWVAAPEELAPFDGVVISNELFDAQPVHLLRWPDEIAVGVARDGRFVEVLRPAGAEVAAALAGAGVDLRRGGRYAVSTDAPALLARLAARLRRGWLVTVDYGGEGLEVHDGRRPPVRTYVGGVSGGDPLSAPGRQDLTADVDFGALRRTAARLGLVERRYELQEDWLRRHGAVLDEPADRDAAGWRLAGLLEGRLSFRVLIHERRAPDRFVGRPGQEGPVA